MHRRVSYNILFTLSKFTAGLKIYRLDSSLCMSFVSGRFIFFMYSFHIYNQITKQCVWRKIHRATFPLQTVKELKGHLLAGDANSNPHHSRMQRDTDPELTANCLSPPFLNNSLTAIATSPAEYH